MCEAVVAFKLKENSKQLSVFKCEEVIFPKRKAVLIFPRLSIIIISVRNKRRKHP